MCGIVGYVGHNEAPNVLLNGLRRLEYRGYDSAGLALWEPGGLRLCRAMGKVDGLAARCRQEHVPEACHLGIAHTRWATHGEPSEANAHPHLDTAGDFACVHNGIIENFKALREQLRQQGVEFRSETDSEVIPHLVAAYYEGDLAAAAAAALRRLEGTFGVALISRHHPGEMVVARKGSPIVIGLGTDETIVASDVSAIISHTASVIYLDDGDLAVLGADEVEIRNLDNMPISRAVKQVDWDIEAVEKGGYEHFMLKEIAEQPEAIGNAIRGRLDHAMGTAFLSGLNFSPRDLVRIDRVVIAACGTSLHAGMVGEYFFEELADLTAEVEQAAEFRYRNPIVNDSTLTIAISQSGETADTLAALREAKLKGAQVIGLCNVVGSTIAREAGRGVYLHAGPEISVASTKAFSCQVAVLLMMALKFGRTRRLPRQVGLELAAEIERLPELVATVVAQAPEIERIANRWARVEHMFYIGRGYLYPAALEGALKLKEISYIHAEGYHAAELKHGPIALLEENTPVVALANDIEGKDKVIGNIQECRARKAPTILTVTEDDHELDDLSEDLIRIPRSSHFLAPVTTVAALQLLAYYVAKARGCEIDQPRNLAKSVTVE